MKFFLDYFRQEVFLVCNLTDLSVSKILQIKYNFFVKTKISIFEVFSVTMSIMFYNLVVDVPVLVDARSNSEMGGGNSDEIRKRTGKCAYSHSKSFKCFY